MRIDAHQHFWQYKREAYSWITAEVACLQRDYLPPIFEPILQQHSLDGCIAVEARGSEKENTFLLDLSDRYPFIKGIVAWLDFREPSIDAALERYAGFAKIKGFRYNVQLEPNPNFLLQRVWLEGVKKLEKLNWTFDILIFPHQLGAVLELARRLPNQKFIINHLAKPYIKDGFYDGWAILMKAIAREPNVWCKISGMVTEADWQNWSYESFVPYLDLVFEAFGTSRLMFGSDWPVCLLAAEDREVVNVLTRYLENFSQDDQTKIWGENAVEFYKLHT